ncbi:Hypothetical protein NCS54_00170900 [Fusarium falciforme]|uniref:Hypothetical protein n=1 Tax=Fusarium falciforme TaxID=195108 RepID=UPI002301802A|nr:Hypothetical protein NCS54_00170900 [Fusarium falciforme]WAO84494.1 Hypothetical protein NCS54_00170900 [Fusarium falciforme]
MMSSAVRPASEVSISAVGTATMAPTTLPPLTFNDPGDLRIVLVPTSDDGDTVSEHPPSVVNHRFSTDSYRSYKAPNQDIPTHPVPAMQEAFAESLDEVTSGGDGPGKPKLRDLDAKGRRARLLEQDAEDEPYDTTWRYRPGQQQHEMYKLISQITFGVYLLLNSLAADNGQVVTILQGHIDEVDEFLEVMLEDFAQAHKDLTERIAHLQLPMANRQAFEGMLEDRNFRAQILSGNEKIDHILARTNAAMKQWDDDIDAGLRSSEAFMEWLNEQKDTKWPDSEPDLNSIFLAMKGNADGWLNAFDELNNQAQDLNGLIIKLMTIVAEMEKTAGEVSRKTWATIPPFSLPVNAPRESTASSSSPSIKSDPKSTPVASIRSSKSTTTLPAASLKPKDPEVNTLNDVSTLSDFPLPGAAPLLPPTRFTPRPSPNLSTPSSSSGPNLSASSPASSGATTPKASVTEEKQEEPEAGDDLGGLDDGPLFILQPRTYTPQPPASPVAKSPESPKIEEQIQRHTLTQSVRESVGLEKRTSLRQRVSQKTTPPVSIQIPPRNTIEIQSSLRPSPGGITPRTSKSQAPDYSHASDLEAYQPHRLPRATSHADFGAPVRPLMPSPHSEHHQFYHNTIPVRASPHSPLQQRPHTAGPADQYHQSGYFPGHQRNQPSRMGAMSTLSSVTTATYDDAATVTSRATTQAGGKRVKKKKSAFGWLKKAFSMDEDEKAEYEARRAMQYRDNYYDGHSPKFLDGKRIR